MALVSSPNPPYIQNPEIGVDYDWSQRCPCTLPAQSPCLSTDRGHCTALEETNHNKFKVWLPYCFIIISPFSIIFSSVTLWQAISINLNHAKCIYTKSLRGIASLCNDLSLKKLNMAGIWPWVPKKLLKWEKAKTIRFHSKLILSACLWKAKKIWQHQRAAVVAAVNLI